MNDKLQQLYDLYKSKGIINTVDFNTFSTADDSQRQKLYELGRKNGLFKTTDYGTFSSAFAPVKKKEVSQSTPSEGGISSAISKMVEKAPLESSAPKDENVYTGFPGKESKKYKLDKSTGVEVWKEYSSTDYNQKTGKQEDVFDKTITDPSRVNALNKQFNAKASTNEVEEVFVGYPGKEKNEYRVKGDLWQRKEKGQSDWTTVTNEGSIKALNYEFGKTINVPAPDEALKISKNESSLSKINNTIDKDLIGQDEEDAISKINKAIKGYNYLEAEQIGAGYDAIRVRNKVTGEYKDISLDNWSSDRDKEESEILKGFLSVNIGNSEYTEKYKQIQDLENKIKTAQPYKVPLIQKEINEAREELKDIDRKRKNDSRENKYKATAVFDKYAVDDINLNISKAVVKTEDLKKKAAEYSEYATTVNEAYRNGKITEEDYKNNYAVVIENNKKEIASEINAIKQDYNDVKKDSILVDDIAGYNYQVEAQRGNVLTGTASAFLKGFEGATRFAFEGISEEAGGFKEGSFQGVMSEQLAPSTVSSVYTSSEGKSTFEQIVFGLAESGGAAMAGVLTGGPQGATLGLYASSYVQLKDQMNTPEFQDVPEYQKVLLSGVYGASVALLEKYGITKGFSKNPVGKRFLNSFLSKMVKELPSDATAEVIEAYVNKNVKTLIAKKAINLTGAGLIEYSTEAGQEATDIGLKSLFNGLQGKKYFETPETWGEVFSQINEAGKLGFIGGAGMQSTTIALNTAKDALTKYQLNNIENTINNEDIKNIYVLNIKDRILSGEITKAQGQKELNKLKESEGLLNKIPANITGDSRYEAFQLINERDELQKATEGKEAALVTPITSRITEINNRLKTISENAVQVETTSEVSLQPEARVGEEVVQGESTTEPQSITEEGKKEVESLRAKEQEEIRAKFPDAEYKADGKIDVDKLSAKDKKAYDKIYAKYDKLISPLLKPTEITIDKPVIAKNATAEVDRVKALPIEAEDGATFNLDGAKYEGVGLVVPVDSMNTTIEELTPEMVADFVEERQKMIGDAGVVKAGIYKFPNSNQVSIDLSIVVPESSREQAIEFGRLADQESLFDLATYENVKTGGTGNNPMKFTPEQHREIAKALKEGRLPDVFAQADNRKKSDNLITESTISNIAQRQTTAIGQKIVTAAKLVMKALPGIKIYIHQTKAEYEDAIGEKTGDKDKGSYTDGEIHINLEAGATLITLYHEAMHHALLVKGMKSGAILDLAKGLRSILSDKEIGKRLDNFISNYDENETAEEYLAELGAIMAESQVELKTKGLLRFKALIGKIAKKLGIPAFSDAMQANDAIDFINALTRDIRTGEEIKGDLTAKSNVIKRQKVDKVTSQVAGNKLFNTPLKEAENIANSYMKSLGMVYTPVEKITKLDEGLSKRIARAYDEMKDDPNNKEVKAAYEAMVKETIDQYDAIVKEGYNVEINNTEPYANSEAMINDLRVNKKMNIFSTESGFGDEPITDKQRAENLLLKDSGKKDINGQTLLVNDIFRFVHDFFGHAKLGNSFGPIGEENAWRVHSEMYSPEARKAMTSETRGQNSWVNFSGVNDAAFKKRDKARELRKEGKIDEANKLVEEVYEDMKFADQKIGLLPEFAVEENAPSKIKRQKITQEERMDIEADGVFKKSLNRGVDWKTAIQNALDYIQKSKWYEGASDIDREQKVRDFKESKKQKLKKAPSVAKVLGKPKAKPVNVKDEMAALKDQIRLEARAARDAKGDLNAKRKMLAAAISNMVKLGKIKAPQAGILIKRISSLNLDNPVIVDRFANYAEKVFDIADYQKRLDDAFALRKSIRKLLNTENQAEVVGMAKEFANIDPSLVEDIDVYIEMAEKVKNAVKPSRIKGFDVIMKEAANIAMVSEFSKAELERQENIKKQELLAIHDYLEDISKDMSLKEIQDIINLLKESPEAVDDKESKVMEFLKNRFDFMAGIVETMINTGVDPMTGEDIQFDEKQNSLMKRVLKIDLNQMSTREAIKIVEGLNNFLTNQITSGLESAVNSYEGATNAQNLVDNGTKAKDVSIFFSKGAGRAYTNQLFSLPLLMERMFNGTKAALNVMTKMGLNTVINGVNLANKLHDNIITSYSKEAFYGKKGFMDQKNVFERGMLAFLKRNLIGSETMVKAEFERRARIIEQSIESLKNSGDKKLVELGEAYQEVYDKLGVAKKDLDIINSRAESMNKEAVDWWIKEWSKHYKDLSDVSLSVYNAMLGSDTNYTPDKFKKIVQTSGVIEDADSIGGIDYTDKNKTGVLIESSRPNNAPSGRYISLDFDSNNSNALKGALVDINTAAGIRQVDGFMSSKAFNSLVPNAKDRAYLVERINNYIRRAKGKRIVNKDVWNDIDSFTNFIGGLGVTQSLAGLSQTISQTGPVITNTLINAGSFIPVTSKSNAWLDKLGMAISNRGMESSSTIESADARIEANDANYAKKTIKAIENVNKFYLKQLLVKPDIWAARSSFVTYYLQDLKNRGISTNFEWDTHEPDMEAANYAQMMVDRQQNISDPLLAGEFMATEDGFKRLMRKVMLPFASFILNQKARMYNDFSTLTSRTSTAQDKKIAARSLSGLVAEMAAYHAIGATVRFMYDEIAKQIMGDEDDEEEKKRKKVNITKYPIRSFINDIISPLPITDGIVTDGANFLLSFYEPLSDEDIRKKVKEKNNALKIKGEYDMTKEEEQEFIDNLKEKNKFQLFTDDQNPRKYGILGIAFDNYSNLYETSKMAYSGEFEDDYQGRITVKKLAGDDKDYVEAALIPLYLSSLGLLPKDFSTVSNRVINRVKKRAFTENQADKIAIVEGELKRKLRPFEIEIVNAKNKPETAIDELNFIKRNGGLTEAQSVEYVKLMEAIGSPTTGDIIKIKRGQKASQILE